MRKFKAEMLIRDSRLDFLQQRDINPDYKILNNDDYIVELKKKLIEEASEITDAKSSDDIAEEIADVLEVIDHLLDIYNISPEKVKEIKNKKLEKLGGFNKKIKTFSVSISEDNKEIEYYLSHPNKYPEIIEKIKATQNISTKAKTK